MAHALALRNLLITILLHWYLITWRARDTWKSGPPIS